MLLDCSNLVAYLNGITMFKQPNIEPDLDITHRHMDKMVSDKIDNEEKQRNSDRWFSTKLLLFGAVIGSLITWLVTYLLS